MSIRGRTESFPLMVSVEGLPTDEILASPALQDLRFEKLSDVVVEFQLLGQAGKGIYSAAVRFDGQSQAIDFDMCARGRAADSPVCTMSRYQIAADGSASAPPQREGGLIVRYRGEPGVDLSPVPIAGMPATECRPIGEGSHRRIAAGRFGIPGSVAPHKPVSVRWRYRIALAGHP